MFVMEPVHSKVERTDCKRVRKGKKKKLRDWNFPGPVVKNPPAGQGAGFPSLVGELRFEPESSEALVPQLEHPCTTTEAPTCCH